MHDRLEAGVEGVQRLLVAFVVGLEPRHIVVIDEAAQGRSASTAAALGDCQRFAVLSGFVEVLQCLFAGLLKCQDADTAKRLLAAAGPGHHIGLRAGRRHAHEQAGHGGVVDFVFLAGDFQAVQSARRQLLSHGVPMGAVWVQK